MSRSYLLATDASDSSQASAQFLQSFLPAEDTTIHLLYVINLFDQGKIREFSFGLEAEELEKRHEQRARKEIEPRAEALNNQGFETTTEIVHGKPGPEICRHARERNVDGIFIGRGRHSRLGEMFQGSVSRYVVKHAPVSVIVTPLSA
jgi:nucleotide-binding universal stress UspA family protein